MGSMRTTEVGLVTGSCATTGHSMSREIRQRRSAIERFMRRFVGLR